MRGLNPWSFWSQVPTANRIARSIKSVQAGTVTLTSTNLTNTATIVAVDTTRTVIIPAGITYNNNGLANEDMAVRFVLTNATTVTMSRAFGGDFGANTFTGAFQVVEYY